MASDVSTQVGRATIKITFMSQRDCESNAIRGDGAEGMLQGTRKTNFTSC